LQLFFDILQNIRDDSRTIFYYLIYIILIMVCEFNVIRYELIFATSINDDIRATEEFKSLISNAELKTKERGINKRISDRSVEEMNLLA